MPLADRQSFYRKSRVDAFLQLGETEPTRPAFSLEEELTDDRLQKMFAALEKYRAHSDKGKYFEMAAAISTLVPNEKLPPSFADERMFRTILGSFQSKAKSRRELGLKPDLLGSSQKIQLINRFFPGRDRLFHFDQYLNFFHWENKLEDERKENLNFFYSHAFEYSILAPDQRDAIAVNRETFDAIRPWIEDFKEHVLLERGQSFSFHSYEKFEYVIFLAHVAALHPDLKTLLPIDDELFTIGKAELRQLEAKEYWCNFTTLLQGLTILAADHVEFTSPGIIRIIPVQEKLSSTTPLPQMREF